MSNQSQPTGNEDHLIINQSLVAVSNVSSSLAGSGSGDFLKVRKMRIKEEKRLHHMEVEHKKKIREENFQRRRIQRKVLEKLKTQKKATKRQKRKELKKKARLLKKQQIKNNLIQQKSQSVSNFETNSDQNEKEKENDNDNKQEKESPFEKKKEMSQKDKKGEEKEQEQETTKKNDNEKEKNEQLTDDNEIQFLVPQNFTKEESLIEKPKIKKPTVKFIDDDELEFDNDSDYSDDI
ncbi:prkr-interacting protein [Anaeramoeba flamelloides]|uniref:Prkr-interacting protein n=1 Tax=Anaeramoeba flamelloides TaxID=1746091 RepID=A0ABQ8XH04_9EUKA|nr:prkr-interacting protein [Anaeramoeba flamelloides]